MFFLIFYIIIKCIYADSSSRDGREDCLHGSPAACVCWPHYALGTHRDLSIPVTIPFYLNSSSVH